MSPTPFEALYVTLDSHHKYDIAHPGYWKVAETGEPPAPFTLITDAEVSSGKYVPSDPSNLAWAKSYTSKLAAKGSFTLCIWPEVRWIDERRREERNISMHHLPG